jgi:hypothetical protein
MGTIMEISLCQTITHGSDGTTEIKNEDYVTAGKVVFVNAG